MPDIATVRANIAAARGKTPDNYRDTVTWKLADGTVAKEQTFKRDGNTRVVEDAGGSHRESGVFEGAAWHQDENGHIVFDAPDPSATGGTRPETARVEAGAGPDAPLVINDVGANGFGSREYIDAKTFSPLRKESIGRNGTTKTNYDAFAQFGGQRLLSKWTVTTPVSTIQYTRTERAIGVVTASDVAMPTK